MTRRVRRSDPTQLSLPFDDPPSSEAESGTERPATSGLPVIDIPFNEVLSTTADFAAVERAIPSDGRIADESVPRRIAGYAYHCQWNLREHRLPAGLNPHEHLTPHIVRNLYAKPPKGRPVFLYEPVHGGFRIIVCDRRGRATCP